MPNNLVKTQESQSLSLRFKGNDSEQINRSLLRFPVGAHVGDGIEPDRAA
jgi:hypothetical protein